MILEQARNILIAGLLISVVVMVNWVYKTNNPICPDDYNDPNEQAAALDKWLGSFYDSNPDATIAEMGEARKDFFVKHHCKEALQRLEDIQSGKADPEIVQMIDDVIKEKMGDGAESEINELERRVNENIECIQNLANPNYLETDACKVLTECLNNPDCRNRLEATVNEIYTRGGYPTTTLEVMISGSRNHD